MPGGMAYWEGNCQLAEMKVARPESSRRRGWNDFILQSALFLGCANLLKWRHRASSSCRMVYNPTSRPLKNSDGGTESEAMKRIACRGSGPRLDVKAVETAHVYHLHVLAVVVFTLQCLVQVCMLHCILVINIAILMLSVDYASTTAIGKTRRAAFILGAAAIDNDTAYRRTKVVGHIQT
jgi:hypothetical protein